MRRLIFFLAAVCCSCAYAQPSIDSYGALPTIQDMAVSPNGELIAFRNVTATEDILRVLSLKESKMLAAVDVSLVKPRRVFFVNDRQVLLLVEENRRVQRFRGRFDVSTLFSLDIESGKIRQLLTPGDGVVFPGQSGLGKIVGVSPDGNYVYMPAFFGQLQRVINRYMAPPYALLQVGLNGGGKPRNIKLGSNATEDFFVDAQGEPIAMEEFDETNNLHRVSALQDGEWNDIFQEETEFKNRSFVGLTPDGKSLVMLDTNRDNDRTAYFTVSLESGEVEGPLYGRDDADIVNVVIDLQRVVHGLLYSGFTPTYRFFDQSLDQRVRDIQAFFPDHSVSISSHSPDWKHILVLMQGSQSAGEYYLFSEGQSPRFIASQRPDVSPDDVNLIGMVTFTARDGMRIPSLITIPRDRISDMKNLPAVVMPHGGPTSYDQVGFNYRAQALATQGYLVIMPQFRGSSGFGESHQVAGYGEWGRKMQDDISDAVDFFATRGMIDPDRVCIVGASYGGYAALAGGAFTPGLYKCVVAINGIGDLRRFHTLIRSAAGRSSEALAYWETQIGDDEYTPEEAQAASPEYAVDNFSAPVLVIGSKADQVVPFSQSEDMVRALKRAGKEVEFVELDGDDHYLSFGATRTEALQAVVSFVNEHL